MYGKFYIVNREDEAAPTAQPSKHDPIEKREYQPLEMDDVGLLIYGKAFKRP